MMCKYFYRVTVSIDEGASLAFDFKTMKEAGLFADIAFRSCDIYIVKIEIIENEIDTTNSPMWRE